MWNKFRLPLMVGLVFYSSLIASVGLAAGGDDHLRNAAQGQCLQADSALRIIAGNCVANEPKQIWSYNAAKQLVNANGQCLTSNALRNSPVYLSSCSLTKSKEWVYDAATQLYKNSQTKQCLNVANGALNGVVNTLNCTNVSRQQWQFTAIAPAAKWLDHDLKLNGIGVGVDSVNKILLVPLGDGFNTPVSFDAAFTYTLSGYALAINSININNGGSFHFNSIKYGSSIPVRRYLNGALVDTYNLVFTNLPVIQLSAAEIVDEPKLPGSFRLMSGKFNQDTGIQNMGIEFRGSTAQAYPKKPYGIKIGTPDNWAVGLDVKLLDMRKDSDWILDAAYRDQTFVRNIVSHDIYRSMRPSAYVDLAGVAKGQAAIKGQLVEVIQNESYQGVYVLEEKPDRKLYDLKKIAVPTDANGLAQWNLVDFNNPENGSVLYKADEGSTVFYDTTSITTNFQQDYPKPEDIVRWEPLLEFANFVATATDAEFIAGIGARIDIDSVVDWWLLVDASSAGDNMKKNFYLAKSGSGKFFMATWDHDATFGMDWEGSIYSDSLTESLTQWQYPENNLIRRLIELPATGFNAKLKARWNALRSSVFNQANLSTRFQVYLDEAAKGGAQARNQFRWPGTGGAGASASDTRLGKISFINDLLAIRLPLLDQVINALPEQ
ncbi:MAG: CotH kinase family protein [Methylococcales bacterium]